VRDLNRGHHQLERDRSHLEMTLTRIWSKCVFGCSVADGRHQVAALVL